MVKSDAVVEVAARTYTTSAVVVPDAVDVGETSVWFLDMSKFHGHFVFAHGNSSGVVGYWRTMDWDLVSLYLQSRRQGGVGRLWYYQTSDKYGQYV